MFIYGVLGMVIFKKFSDCDLSFGLVKFGVLVVVLNSLMIFEIEIRD